MDELDRGGAFAWIAATIGLTVRDPETAQSAGFLWMFPLTFASAAFARPPRCPAGCNQSSSQSDHRPHRGAARPHHRRAGVGPVLQSIAWIAGLTLVFAPLAIHRYRRLA
jgi:hypothetical protein